MNVEHAEKVNEDQSDSSHSGKWIRDQLREVADSGLAELERSATARSGKVEDPEVEKADQTVLDNLAASISTAVVEPIRSLERTRAAHQHQMEASLATLSNRLEDFQTRFGALDRELESAKQAAARSQSLVNEIRPGISAVERQVKQLEETFRHDLKALGEGLQQLREQVKPMDARLQGSEEAVAKHTVALEAVARLERRRQEASRQLVTSVDGLRSSLNRLSNLELVAAKDQEAPKEPLQQAPKEPVQGVEPPAPEFLDENNRED